MLKNYKKLKKVETEEVPELTLIDTPGHAAFESMRRRGARFVDAAILVVAGTEGVMPTTKECIRILRKAGTKFVVALNKSDLPDFNAARAKRELAEMEVYAEEEGGENAVFITIFRKIHLELKNSEIMCFFGKKQHFLNEIHFFLCMRKDDRDFCKKRR